MPVPDEYIYFRERPVSNPARKTKTWYVISKGDETVLGLIRWFGRWRCYAFFPISDTVFEKKCLRTIANFCEEHHKDRN